MARVIPFVESSAAPRPRKHPSDETRRWATTVVNHIQILAINDLQALIALAQVSGQLVSLLPPDLM